MEIKGHYYLGKILKSVGLNGHVIILLDVDNPEQYAGLDAVFVYVGGSLVPILVDELQLRSGKQAQVKLHDIESVDQTDVLIGQMLYLPLTALPELDENQFYYHEIFFASFMPWMRAIHGAPLQAR